MGIRIIFLVIIVVSCVACIDDAAQEHPTQLVIATFGGEWGGGQKNIWFDEFTKETGIEIVVVEYNGDYQLTRAKATSGEWDILDIEELEMLRGIDDGLWSPIDYSNIAKDELLPEAALEYAVGSVAYAIVLGYDSLEFSANQIDGWNAFFDPEKFEGTRAMRNAPQYMIEAAWLSRHPNLETMYTGDPNETVAEIGQILSEFKGKSGPGGLVTFETYAQPQDLIHRNTASLAPGTNGRMVGAALEQKTVGMSGNQAILNVEYYVVSKNTNNRGAAMSFLAYATSRRPQASMGRHIPYGPVNTAALALLTTKELERLPTAPEVYPMTQRFDASWWLTNERAAREMYREFLILN